MTIFRILPRLAPLLLAGGVWLSLSAPLRGQDPFGSDPAAPPAGSNPFGGAPAAAPGSPFGPPAAAPGAPAAGAPVPDDPLQDDDPLVQSILDPRPRSPEQLMTAISLLTNLRRGDLVKVLVKQLESANLNRAQLAALERRHGAGLFVTLVLDGRYAPEGRAFAQKVLQAAKDAAQDPARLESLVSNLSSPQASTRLAALVDLKAVGIDALPPILQALADPARSGEHEAIRLGAAQLGGYLAPPLIGALQTSDAALKAQIIEVLGAMRAESAVPYLLGPVHDPNSPAEVRQAAANALARLTGGVPEVDEAAAFLKIRARDYLAGSALGSGDPEGMAEVWFWDEGSQSPMSRRLPTHEAARLIEARLAEQIFAMAPDDLEHRRLRLMSGLAAAKLTHGIDSPIPESPIRSLCQQLGPAAVQDVLIVAMRQERPLAATAAAEVLGNLQDETVLYTSGPPPLVTALIHPDRRLRFAALEAIIKLRPQKAYAGSSVAVDTLGYFIATLGSRRVLIGHPYLERGQTWAGMLAELGYEADFVSNGRDLVRQLTANPDYDLVLVSGILRGPPLNEALQRLREQPAGGQIPLALLSLERLSDMERLAREDPMTLASPPPISTARMDELVRSLLALHELPPVDHHLRLRQAEQALQWLDEVSQHPRRRTFYDLNAVREALHKSLLTPQCAVISARLLGRLGAHPDQQALVSVASTNTLPLEVRSAAVSAFQHAVQRRGLLLTRNEVLLQYDRYNQSKHLDRETQQVLGAVLDVIESPAGSSPILPAAPGG